MTSSTYDTYDVLAVMMAIAVGVGAFVYSVLLARRERGFLTHRYLKWLAVVFVWSLIVPFACMWATPIDISYTDAALLRVRSVGWRHVLFAYLALLGLIAGGVVGALMNVLAPVKDRDD